MTDTSFIQCTTCGATNRVPQDKLEQGLRPTCGSCKAALVDGGRPVIVSDATFASLVEGAPMPVLLDMWAAWCGPCQLVAPVIDELASTMAGRVRIGKLNVDENPATAARFGVRSIPTLLVFKHGQEVDRIVGVQPKPEIIKRLERVIG